MTEQARVVIASMYVSMRRLVLSARPGIKWVLIMCTVYFFSSAIDLHMCHYIIVTCNRDTDKAAQTHAELHTIMIYGPQAATVSVTDLHLWIKCQYTDTVQELKMGKTEFCTVTPCTCSVHVSHVMKIKQTTLSLQEFFFNLAKTSDNQFLWKIKLSVTP